MTTTTFSATITRTERLRNSRNGNPRWEIKFDDGRAYSTVPDSGVNTIVGNAGTGEGDRVTAHLAGDGIFKLEPADPQAGEVATLKALGYSVGNDVMAEHGRHIAKGVVIMVRNGMFIAVRPDGTTTREARLP